jgi:hypothetical protein
MDDWTDGQRDDGMDDGPDGFRGGFISHPHVLYNILVATENLQNHFFSKFLIFGEISPVKKWLLGFRSTANTDELPKFQLT